MDELLKILKHNALETPSNLAKMLNLSIDDVKARIADYEKRGIIRGYQAVVNEDQLNMGRVNAAIEVKVTPDGKGGFDHVAERVGKFPEVQAVYLMSGGFDLLLLVEGHDLKEIAFFVSEKLATIKGIVATSTHFILKTYKAHGLVMNKQHDTERLQISP